MKKMAIFVEGQTEMIFIEKLIYEIGNRNQISIQKEVATGGSKGSQRNIELLAKDAITSDTSYHILIRNSSCDDRVLSDLVSQYKTLKSQGYQLILGLKDLFPKKINEKAKVQKIQKLVLTNNDIPDNALILSIMEIETWFIAEKTHFSKIHSSLDFQKISSVIDFSKITDFETDITNPADTLHDIYNTVGYAYKKTRRQVERTVNVIDIPDIYINIRKIVPSLNELLCFLDDFFAKSITSFPDSIPSSSHP